MGARVFFWGVCWGRRANPISLRPPDLAPVIAHVNVGRRNWVSRCGVKGLSCEFKGVPDSAHYADLAEASRSCACHRTM